MCVASRLPHHIRIKQITFARFWSNADAYQVVQVPLYLGLSRTCFAFSCLLFDQKLQQLSDTGVSKHTGTTSVKMIDSRD